MMLICNYQNSSFSTAGRAYHEQGKRQCQPRLQLPIGRKFVQCRVSTELKLKVQPKFQKKETFFKPFGQKTALFSSHTMNFDVKFQPLKMQPDYCQKVLSNLKISNKLEFPIIIQCLQVNYRRRIRIDQPPLAKHREYFQSWLDLVKEKGLSHVILNNIFFCNPVS